MTPKVSAKNAIQQINHSRTRANAPESLLFINPDQALLEIQKKINKMEETKEALAEASGIQDKAILQKLADLNIRPATLASLALVPLIEVAWADGEIDEKEKNALLEAAAQIGMKKSNIDLALFRSLIGRKPDPVLLKTWTRYIRSLCRDLTIDEIKKIRDELIGRAHDIAKVSGGILGFGIGDRLSRKEHSMLAKLRRAFIV